MNTYEIIKLLRQQMNLSQDELAKKTGYTDRSSIAKIEAGKVDLTESKIILFAKALDVTPAQLMGVKPISSSSDSFPLSPDERQLVEDYRGLTPPGQEYIRQTMAMAKMSYSEKNDALPNLEDAK